MEDCFPINRPLLHFHDCWRLCLDQSIVNRLKHLESPKTLKISWVLRCGTQHRLQSPMSVQDPKKGPCLRSTSVPQCHRFAERSLLFDSSRTWSVFTRSKDSENLVALSKTFSSLTRWWCQDVLFQVPRCPPSSLTRCPTPWTPGHSRRQHL